MIAPSQLFSTDPGNITDFTSVRPADIFNNAILPKLTSLQSLLGEDPAGLDEATQRRDAQAQVDEERYLFNAQQDDAFLTSLRQNQQAVTDDDVGVDYNAPVAAPQAQTQAAPQSSNSEPQGAAAPSLTRMPKNGVDFIKHFEAGGAKQGFYPEAYWDYGQWSIGYGTRAKKGEVIDKQEAERRLSSELSSHRARVENLNKKAGYGFTENEMDALTSFDYNTGRLEQLTENGKRDKATIARKILEYNKADGKVLKGLIKRRQAEQQLFTQGY